MALTSSLWPSKVLRGCVSPSLQTWIILSVLQVAKEVLFLQSTSSVGAAHALRPVNYMTSVSPLNSATAQLLTQQQKACHL